ncbi:hypothetical protein [Burkholderia gladioli]|uniref:hypothetical protein n=1 Tax=Burkholderia gladioli TaxID=28095 RepID=UPI0016422B9A|nr:hypothetical protein [Burkholderia gladioli]
MEKKNEEIKRETQEWMRKHASSFTHAVTLTMKQSREVMTTKGLTRQHLTEIEAKENFRLFLRNLSIVVYGKAAKRFGVSVHVIPVIEGLATDKRLHYHCMIGNFRPEYEDAQITSMIHAAWLKTDFGYAEIDVQPLEADGWINYITKEVGMGDADNVDYDNVHLPKE